MNMAETSERRLKQIEILLATAAKTINCNAEASSDRMDRIERLAEANTTAIDRLTERMGRAEERMDRSDAKMGEIAEMFVESVGIIRQQQANFDKMQANIDKMQTEVRGLQVENQRILLRIFGGDEYLDPN
jgi:methyl-accepting chemotaxis protein